MASGWRPESLSSGARVFDGNTEASGSIGGRGFLREWLGVLALLRFRLFRFLRFLRLAIVRDGEAWAGGQDEKEERLPESKHGSLLPQLSPTCASSDQGKRSTVRKTWHAGIGAGTTDPAAKE